MEELLTLAQREGFDCCVPLEASVLNFRPEVRQMCKAGRCGSYGHNWCCPPACPELEIMQQRMTAYGTGVLVQTVARLEDDFDVESMMEAEKNHKQRFERLTETLWQTFGAAQVLPMGAGTCQRCKACTYPDAPCRFPEKQIISMEAYGLLVSEVCQSCGAAYYHGPQTMCYTSCVFLKNPSEVCGTQENSSSHLQ